MSTSCTLPVLLVSAATADVAASVVSELIDNDVTEEYNKDIKSPDRVWRLVNKYYTADVRVHALTDTGQLSVDPHTVEAHVIHITDEEERADAGVAAAERRAASGEGAWARSAVRVLLLAGAAPGAALAAWARCARAHVAPLAEPPAPSAPAEPFAEERGVAGARATLHAHAWRGLTRTDHTDDRGAVESPGSVGSGSESEGSSLESWEGVLESVAALRDARPSLDEPRGERLARAERLLAALRLPWD